MVDMHGSGRSQIYEGANRHSTHFVDDSKEDSLNSSKTPDESLRKSGKRLLSLKHTSDYETTHNESQEKQLLLPKEGSSVGNYSKPKDANKAFETAGTAAGIRVRSIEESNEALSSFRRN